MRTPALAVVLTVCACAEKPTPDSVRAELPPLERNSIAQIHAVPGGVEVVATCRDLGRFFAQERVLVEDGRYGDAKGKGDVVNFMKAIATSLDGKCAAHWLAADYAENDCKRLEAQAKPDTRAMAKAGCDRKGQAPLTIEMQRLGPEDAARECVSLLGRDVALREEDVKLAVTMAGPPGPATRAAAARVLPLAEERLKVRREMEALGCSKP